MATFTEPLRLCYSSMSIWKLNFVSFMRLFVQLTIEINVSQQCIDQRSSRIDELSLWLASLFGLCRDIPCISGDRFYDPVALAV